MSNPTISFETNSDIETDITSLVLTDVAGYEGAIDIQLWSSTKVLSYKVLAYHASTRVVVVKVWDDETADGAGEPIRIDVDTIATIHVF